MVRRSGFSTVAVWCLLAATGWLVGCDRGSAPAPETGGIPVVESGVDSALDAQATSVDVFERAFQRHDTDLPVLARGTVSRILSDDVEGDRHQRFILLLSNGQTLLVAHNIDLSSRVEGLRTGTVIYAQGIYEWNAEGGVVHWTHRDPDGRHPPGWIRYFGVRYD